MKKINTFRHVATYDKKHKYHGYYAMYVNEGLITRLNMNHGESIGYAEWHGSLKETKFYIK